MRAKHVDERQKIEQAIAEARRAPTGSSEMIHESAPELHRAARLDAHLVREQLGARPDNARPKVGQNERGLRGPEHAQKAWQHEGPIARERNLVERWRVRGEKQPIPRALGPGELLPADSERGVPIPRPQRREQHLAGGPLERGVVRAPKLDSFARLNGEPAGRLDPLGDLQRAVVSVNRWRAQPPLGQRINRRLGWLRVRRRKTATVGVRAHEGQRGPVDQRDDRIASASPIRIVESLQVLEQTLGVVCDDVELARAVHQTRPRNPCDARDLAPRIRTLPNDQ